MNRQEAAREIDNMACCFSDKRFRDAMHMAADALRGPQPDPETGLVPCGCGGKAELCKAVKPNDGTSFVQCTECSLSTAAFMSEERARDEWNRAMGMLEVEESK